MNRGVLGNPPLLVPSEPTPLGDTGMELAYTMLPYEASTTGGTGSANRAYFMRAFGYHRQATKLRIHIGTNSGTISLAVYDNNTLPGKNARPLNRKATTGTVTPPGTGTQEFTLDTAVDVLPGDWLCLVSDNTTITFGRGSATVLDFSGFAWAMAQAPPAPSWIAPGSGFVPSTGFWIVTA